MGGIKKINLVRAEQNIERKITIILLQSKTKLKTHQTCLT